MVKKLFFIFLMGVFLLAFNNPILAQEEKEAEDIEEFSLEELLNVEITTAGKQAEKISEIPASVAVVTREDIEKYGYQNLVEILENILGLYYTDDYFVRNFGVRGFWTVDPLRNVIILVNDVKQTDEVTGAQYLQQLNIPPEAIDRIEVVKGPMSVIYGTGAFFGAINIKTNQVKEGETNSMVSASYGSEESVRLFVRSAGTSGDFQYSFNGSYFDTAGQDADMELIGGSAYAGVTTKGWLENQEKFFNFSGKFKDFIFNASYTEAEKEALILLLPTAEGTLVSSKAARVSFGYNKAFSEKARVDVKVLYFLNWYRFNYDLVLPDLYAVQNNQASGYRAELSLFLYPTPQLNIILGVDYNNVLDDKVETDNPFFGINNKRSLLSQGETIVTQAAYAQFNYKISDRFKIVAGARLEQSPEYTWETRFGITDATDPAFGTYTTAQTTYSYTTAEFIPRVALILSPNDKNYFKLLYGKAINRPSFFQQTSNLGAVTVPTLEPETIQTFELNYIGNLSPKFSVNLSIFHNILEKLIYRSFFTSAGTTFTRFLNVGEMKTTGGELTLTARPTEAFHLELSGMYQKTEDKRPGFENIDVWYSPEIVAYFKASYFFTKDISLAVNGSYVGEMYPFFDDTRTTPSYLGEKVDSYFLLGANLRIRNLITKGLFLNVRGSNLLDEEIHYPATSNNWPYATYGALGRGLTFLVTLGVKFEPEP